MTQTNIQYRTRNDESRSEILPLRPIRLRSGQAFVRSGLKAYFAQNDKQVVRRLADEWIPAFAGMTLGIDNGVFSEKY